MDYSHCEEIYVKLTTYSFLEYMLKEVDKKDDMNSQCVTPTAENLFIVVETLETLTTDKADHFHRIVARLLFASKIEKPDLQLAVEYLCTRVKCPNEEDYDKLRRVIKYIRRTIHSPLLLG